MASPVSLRQFLTGKGIDPATGLVAHFSTIVLARGLRALTGPGIAAFAENNVQLFVDYLDKPLQDKLSAASAALPIIGLEHTDSVDDELSPDDAARVNDARLAVVNLITNIITVLGHHPVQGGGEVRGILQQKLAEIYTLMGRGEFQSALDELNQDKVLNPDPVPGGDPLNLDDTILASAFRPDDMPCTVKR
jgi:hypothetical protein